MNVAANEQVFFNRNRIRLITVSAVAAIVLSGCIKYDAEAPQVGSSASVVEENPISQALGENALSPLVKVQESTDSNTAKSSAPSEATPTSESTEADISLAQREQLGYETNEIGMPEHGTIENGAFLGAIRRTLSDEPRDMSLLDAYYLSISQEVKDPVLETAYPFFAGYQNPYDNEKNTEILNYGYVLQNDLQSTQRPNYWFIESHNVTLVPDADIQIGDIFYDNDRIGGNAPKAVGDTYELFINKGNGETSILTYVTTEVLNLDVSTPEKMKASRAVIDQWGSLGTEQSPRVVLGQCWPPGQDTHRQVALLELKDL